MLVGLWLKVHHDSAIHPGKEISGFYEIRTHTYDNAPSDKASTQTDRAKIPNSKKLVQSPGLDVAIWVWPHHTVWSDTHAHTHTESNIQI